MNLKTALGTFGHLGRKFWMPFLLACGVVALLEAGLDYLVGTEELPNVTQSIFNLSGVYQRLVTAPRDPLPHYTAIIEINPERDPGAVSLLETCQQREMMVQLLTTIASALPNVIVLDKYYPPHKPKPCPKDDELIAAINALRASKIPTIVGRRVSDESIGEGAAARYYLMPSIVPSDQWMEGVVNIDPDTRKLPLQWSLFASKKDAESGQSQTKYYTLALQAGRAYDEKLLAHHPGLERFVDTRTHPYISFVNEHDLDPILSCQVLPRTTQGDDAPCPKPPINNRRLSGRVVLVGEINRDLDSHPSVVGTMPGVYLQANYIEALLDDRFFRPIPILDYVLGFLILVGLEFILIAYRGHWIMMAILIVCLFATTLGLLYLTIMHLRWYVNPALVSATAVIIKCLHSLLGKAEKAAEN